MNYDNGAHISHCSQNKSIISGQLKIIENIEITKISKFEKFCLINPDF